MRRQTQLRRTSNWRLLKTQKPCATQKSTPAENSWEAGICHGTELHMLVLLLHFSRCLLRVSFLLISSRKLNATSYPYKGGLHWKDMEKIGLKVKQNRRIPWLGRDPQGWSKSSSWPCTGHLNNHTMCVKGLSKRFLNFVRLCAATTSLGSLFQRPTTLCVKNLFLIPT